MPICLDLHSFLRTIMVRSYEQVGTIGGNQWSLTQQKTYTKKVMNGIDQQKQAPIKDMCVGGGGSHT